MTRLAGSLLSFIQCTWEAAVIPGTAAIIWSEGWWDSKHPLNPQISVTDLTSVEIGRYNTGGSLAFKYKPMFLVNVWQQIPVGASGTWESQNVENMRFEVAKLFRTYFSGTAVTGANYAGSLGPFCVVLPVDYGRPLHELDKEPRMLRYEITLFSTRDNEQ